jgi:DNA-binding transcriptional ArsR family regulator
MSERIPVPGASVCSDLCNVPCFKEELVARLRAELPADDTLEDARALFASLADKTRLRLLFALRAGEELCVCDVAHVLGISVSVASHHLRKLRDLKVLKYRNDGKMAYYSLRNPLARELVTRVLPAARAGG